MKQGRASPNGPAGQKREPIPHAVKPCAAGNIGLAQGGRATSQPLYSGRGLEAPLKSHVTYPKGSQGKR